MKIVGFLLLILTGCVHGGGKPEEPGAKAPPAPAPATTPPEPANRPLVNPFLVDAAAKPKAAGPAFSSCGTPPPPVVDLEVDSFYSDKSHSVIDKKRKAANQAAVEPLHQYFKSVNRMVEAYVASRPRADAPARCALTWLAAWARADALLGKANNQGAYEQKWTLGILSLAYLRVRDVPGQKAQESKEVEQWLHKIAEKVKARYEASDRDDARNNHAYWAGMAVAAAGIATGDTTLFRWGVQEFEVFAKEVGTDGTLPLEVARKVRALHYHAFAAQPLVLIAMMAGANHVALAPRGEAGLAQLVGLVVRAYKRPELLEKAAGSKQEALKPEDLVFLEVFARSHLDAEVQSLLESIRPLKDERFGGNATLLFAR